MASTGLQGVVLVVWLLGSGCRSGLVGPEEFRESPLELVVASDWVPVPTFVVPEVPLPRGSWKRNAGWSDRVLEIAHRVTSSGELEITVSDSDGFSGAPAWFRLSPSDDGRLSVWISASLFSCVHRGRCIDLAGEVRLEDRARGSREPLRLAFRLDAIEGEWLDTLRMEGALEVSLASSEWDCELSSPAYTEVIPSSALRETWWRWADGTARAHGWVDRDGRRHGPWETWYPNGVRQTVTEFEAGERHGSWRSFHEDGSPLEEGRVVRGLREGDG